MGIYNIKPGEYNNKLAEALKNYNEINAPDWSSFVKSSAGKERPIDEENFWYKRTASILRQIYINKTIGVNRLKSRYGTKKNRGYKPEKFVKGSGKIIRTILQQTDKAGITELTQGVKGVRSRKPGRQLTKKGKELLESIGEENE